MPTAHGFIEVFFHRTILLTYFLGVRNQEFNYLPTSRAVLRVEKLSGVTPHSHTRPKASSIRKLEHLIKKSKMFSIYGRLDLIIDTITLEAECLR